MMIQNFDHCASFTTTHWCDCWFVTLHQNSLSSQDRYRGALIWSRATWHRDIGSGFVTFSLVGCILCSLHNLSWITTWSLGWFRIYGHSVGLPVMFLRPYLNDTVFHFLGCTDLIGRLGMELPWEVQLVLPKFPSRPLHCNKIMLCLSLV